MSSLHTSQPVALNFQAIPKTTNRDRQLHVISIKKHSHVPKGLSDFVQKPDEPEYGCNVKHPKQPKFLLKHSLPFVCAGFYQKSKNAFTASGQAQYHQKSCPKVSYDALYRIPLKPPGSHPQLTSKRKRNIRAN
jgi:hypothetical protein